MTGESKHEQKEKPNSWLSFLERAMELGSQSIPPDSSFRYKPFSWYIDGYVYYGYCHEDCDDDRLKMNLPSGTTQDPVVNVCGKLVIPPRLRLIAEANRRTTEELNHSGNPSAATKPNKQ